MEQPANASGRPLGVGTAAARVPRPGQSLGAPAGTALKASAPNLPGDRRAARPRLFSRKGVLLQMARPGPSPAQETVRGAAVPFNIKEEAPSRAEVPAGENGSGKTDVSWAALPIARRAPRPGRGRLSLERSPELGPICRFTKLMSEHFTERSAGSHVV